MNRFFLIFTLATAIATQTHAQEPDSTIKTSREIFTIMEIYNPWLLSDNPAGMRFNPDIRTSDLSLNYDRANGNYKRPMDGDSIQKYIFSTSSFTKVGKSWFFGNFSYEKSFERNCNFTQVNDPYRLTPYLLVDTMQRDDVYDREFFNLRGDISTPFARLFSWGLSVNMDVGLAAQNRDPRPENKVMNLDISQGLLFNPGIFTMGVNVQYSYYNEDIESDIIEENAQYAFLQLHGFDTYTSHVAASFNRLYQRTTYGVGGQAGLNTGRFNSLTEFKFLYLEETAGDGRRAGNASWSYMKDDSRFLGNIIRIFNASTFSHGKIHHQVHASYSIKYLLGLEVMQRLEQVGEAGAVDWVDYGSEEKYGATLTGLKVNYVFLLMQERYRENLELKIGVEQKTSDRSYYLPDMQESYSNRWYTASARKSFYTGKHAFVIGAGISSGKNLSATLDAATENFITRYLVQPEFNFYNQNTTGFWVSADYSVELNRFFEKYYAGVRAGGIRAEDERERRHFKFHTGVMF